MDIDRYWQISLDTMNLIVVLLEAVLISRFMMSFLKDKKKCVLIGISYFSVLIFLWFWPWYAYGASLAYAIGVIVTFVVMIMLDGRNRNQKFFLSVIIYLLCWIASMVASPLEDFVIKATSADTGAGMSPVQALIMFDVVSAVFYTVRIILLFLMLRLILHVYTDKKHETTGKELLVLLAPVLSIVLGYWMLTFFLNSYVDDTGQTFFLVHASFRWFLSFYQVIAFVSILVVIRAYQQISQGMQEEKERALLRGQMTEMEHHIHQVEKMYGEIRGVRHDLAGHIMVIDNLIEEQEYAQAKEYMEGLKNESAGMDTKVKTGNPVTDIILHEKDGEATAEGIRFEADFRFPGTGKVEAFDLSIVLNNALSNAIAGAKESGEKYIVLRSWMDNNAYMIEVRNSFGGTLIMDEETGLPLTSKSNKQDHGFGLINIRKIAAKYHGDFMLEQEAGEVCLTVLMMVI